MPITYEVDQWLQQRGRYEHHCFVSWPHTIDPYITDCARAVKTAIEGSLASSFHDPKVFLDETEITGGAEWEASLQSALCKSVSMVAICAPIYYRPEHRWCGLEWAAMEHLGSSRLRGRDFKAIIPVMVRMSGPLPTAVSRIQYIDFSGVTTLGRRYFSVKEFRLKIQEIVRRIEQIAEELWRSESMADCEMFQFPRESAFSDYPMPAQNFPLID